MITSGLIITYIDENKNGYIKIINDDNTTNNIDLGLFTYSTTYNSTNYPINLTSISSRVGTSNFVYVKSVLSNATILVNLVYGYGTNVETIFTRNITDNVDKYNVVSYNNDKVKENGIISNTDKDVIKVYNSTSETSSFTQYTSIRSHDFMFLYKTIGIYDIDATVSVIETNKNNIPYLILTFDNIDISNVRTDPDYKFVCKLSINGNIIENDANNDIEINDTSIIYYIPVTPAFKTLIEYSEGDTLIILAELKITSDDDFVYAESTSTLSYPPITIDDSLKVVFNNNDQQYNITNPIKYIIPSHDALYTGTFYVSNDSARLNYDIASSGDFNYVFNLGETYNIKTELQTPFNSKTLTSNGIQFYHSEQYLNITDVKLEASGSLPSSFSYYNGSGEDVQSNKLNTRYMSDGNINITAKFKLKANNSILLANGVTPNNIITTQITPTKANIIVYKRGCEFESNIPNAKLTRSSDVKLLYPNISTITAKRILDNVTTYPTNVITNSVTYPSGYLNEGYDYTISATVANDGEYGVFVVLETGTSTYGYNYTAYNLTNLTSDQTNSQFDF